MCKPTHLLIAVLFSVLAGMPAWAQPGAMESADLVIRTGRVFDGTDWRSDLTIVIAGDRVLEITNQATRYQGRVELDASAWTVIPGLIDAHMHILDPSSEVAVTPWVLEQLEQALRAGVTTIQSTSDVTEDIVELRSRIEAGLVQAPRLFVTGSLIGAVGGSRSLRCGPGTVRCSVSEVANGAEVQAVVAQLASAGVDAVKLLVDHNFENTLTPSLVRDIIEAAHGHGLRVFGHIDYAADARAAVEAGLDGLVHPVPWRTGPVDAVAELLAQRAIPVTTTLSLRAPYLTDGVMTTPWGIRYPDDRFRRLQHGLAVVRAMHEAGVPLVAGTDNSLRSHRVPAQERYIRELQLLVEAGLSTTEALQAATLNAAGFLGKPDLGAIAPNKIADLVILTGDPERNVLELENVLIVVKAGQIVVDNRGE